MSTHAAGRISVEQGVEIAYVERGAGHATTSLQVSAMVSDYRDLAARLSSQLPCANAVRADWISQAEPWLAEHAPEAVLWPLPSHLAFWDSPADFNRRLVEFLHTGS